MDKECVMIICEILARNARMYGDEIALVESDKGVKSAVDCYSMI